MLNIGIVLCSVHVGEIIHLQPNSSVTTTVFCLMNRSEQGAMRTTNDDENRLKVEGRECGEQRWPIGRLRRNKTLTVLTPSRPYRSYRRLDFGVCCLHNHSPSFRSFSHLQKGLRPGTLFNKSIKTTEPATTGAYVELWNPCLQGNTISQTFPPRRCVASPSLFGERGVALENNSLDLGS